MSSIYRIQKVFDIATRIGIIFLIDFAIHRVYAILGLENFQVARSPEHSCLPRGQLMQGWESEFLDNT